MQADSFSLEEIIDKGSLGRHETFAPRYGWLKKGYEAAVQDGNVFRAEDAIERLGVGKNMVRSIRFWCQVFKLLEVTNNGPMRPTRLGRRLLDDNGWDPYLEDIASLWLLHWHLFEPPLEAVNWPLAFHFGNQAGFDTRDLTTALFKAAQRYARLASLSEKSFERDAACLIHMYNEDWAGKESEIDCPFTQLGLIRKTDERNKVCFDINEKQDLPPLIFTAACFSYLAAYLPSGQKTISLSRLTYDFNSPGTVFKVPESTVGYYLNQAVHRLPGVSLVNVSGNMQLRFDDTPNALYWQALEEYYLER